MKKAVLFLILYCFAATLVFGQTDKAPRRAIQPKPAASVAQKNQSAPTEISDAEWTTLSGALAAEDWETSAALASRFLNRLKIDNEKKQLSRLRYLYLYALAGRIFKLSNQRSAVAENAAREELVRATARFTGREFVLPAREFLADCKGVVNYICAAKDGGGKLFRTTATGKNGTEIHSFDYVSFDEAVDLKGFAANKTFLGGTLQRAEFNDDLEKPWIMRLVFERGFARAAK